LGNFKFSRAFVLFPAGNLPIFTSATFREPANAALFSDTLFEVPDAIFIGHPAAGFETEKLLEAEPVEDLELGLFLAEVVVALEHEDGIVDPLAFFPSSLQRARPRCGKIPSRWSRRGGRAEN